MLRISFLAALLAALVFPAPALADFALRDGDTVVFLGDSITAARAYGKVIEKFTYLRYPDRKIHFVNAGWGGDTADGGLKRLERDVLSLKPTVVIVAYGVNDIGWGMRADEEHKQLYLAGVRGIVQQCLKAGARVFICSPAVTGEDPSRSEKGYLKKMADEGMELSRSLGGGAIDIHGTMREVQRRVAKHNEGTSDPKKRVTLHAEDGIHLNDTGQICMAWAILKGLGADSAVSTATIDAAGPKVVEAGACTVTELKGDAEGVEFTRLDKGLPLNLGLIGHLANAWFPLREDLSRYMLCVRDLKDGRYDIVVDGKSIATHTAKELAEGVNIAGATRSGWEPGGTWDAQATELENLVNARNELEQAQKIGRHVDPDPPNKAQRAAAIATANTQLEAIQREVAKPRPYKFVIRPAQEEKKEKETKKQ